MEKIDRRTSTTSDLAHISPLVKSFLVGSLSGSCSAILFQPLDLVKTRLQTSVKPGVRALDAVSVVVGILKNDKVIGLWKGLTPSITRCAPGVGVYFCTLHWLTIRFSESGEATPVEAMCLGSVARSISVISMLPFTVIKTRFESGVYNYGGVLEALQRIYLTEGAKGLYGGLIPTLIRDAPFSGLYLLIYTKVKNSVPKGWREDSLAPATHFVSGIIAGILASAATQPADVVKTRMQLFPELHYTLRHAASHIYQTAGVTGYFRGLAPRMLRRTLVTAMVWTVYEQMTMSVGLK